MAAKKKTAKKPVHSLCWFEIPADDVARAKSFYGKLFGWKINKMPGAHTDYYHIDTGGSDSSLDGGMMKRQSPEQTPTNYISVPSVDKFMDKVKKLGGQVCMPKTEVPGRGYFAV